MLVHFKTLFYPHEANNHKPKFLHLSSLSVLILLLVLFQLFITVFHRVRPGVLGYASNISPDRVIEITNTYRAQAGIGNVVLDASLSEAARQKAEDMFAKNYWAHFSPTGTSPWSFFKNVGYNYLYAGENLARDFNDSDAVVVAWMNSPTHKENIMNAKYKDIGVAVVNGVLNGEETTLVVQMFGTKGGVAQVPEQAATQGVQAAEVYFSSAYDQKIPTPIISSFNLTKSVNLSLLLVLMLVLLIDGIVIFKKKIIRVSSKTFIHLSFLAIIFLIIILTASGQVI